MINKLSLEEFLAYKENYANYDEKLTRHYDVDASEIIDVMHDIKENLM